MPRDKKLTFDGLVEDSKVKLPRDFRSRVAGLFEGKEIVVTVEAKVPARSSDANAYYWAVIIQEIRDGLFEVFGENLMPKEVHEFLKLRFLKVQKVDELTGEVILEYSRSTAGLKVHEFAFYLEECIQFAAVYLQVAIPPPAKFKGEYKFAEFQREAETFADYKKRIAGYLEEIKTRPELQRYFECNGAWKREPEIREIFNERWKVLPAELKKNEKN